MSWYLCTRLDAIRAFSPHCFAHVEYVL